MSRDNDVALKMRWTFPAVAVQSHSRVAVCYTLAADTGGWSCDRGYLCFPPGPSVGEHVVSVVPCSTYLCVPQYQALGVCRGLVPDIQVCGTHGREDLVNATIISSADEEEVSCPYYTRFHCGSLGLTVLCCSFPGVEVDVRQLHVSLAKVFKAQLRSTS